MLFVELKNSNRKGKRLMFVYKDSDKVKAIHFGALGASTYLEHKDKKKRDNYIKRHAVNENWGSVNPGSLSRWILWGDSTDIETNLKDYLKKFNIKKY